MEIKRRKPTLNLDEGKYFIPAIYATLRRKPLKCSVKPIVVHEETVTAHLMKPLDQDGEIDSQN